MTLVDANVLLDLATGDPHWAEWSIAALEAAQLQGPLVINDTIYAEISARYDRIEDVDAFLAAAGVEHAAMPRAALFMAAKAFLLYKKSGGTRTGVLPDFFIGAHAAVAGMPLLTRDATRFRTYFPTVDLITPV